MLGHTAILDGTEFIQVHPTFLYESLWNFVLTALMVAVTLRRAQADRPGGKGAKRIDGLVFCIYLIGYGIGRFWIEGLRTDQLLIPGSQIAVSQVLSGVLAVTGIVLMVILYLRAGGRAR